MWFQLTNGVSTTAPALELGFFGFFPGASIFPRRKNRQKSVPQDSFEHAAAVKFGSPQAFLPLQFVILPTKPVTESSFSFSCARFDRVRLKTFWFPRNKNFNTSLWTNQVKKVQSIKIINTYNKTRTLSDLRYTNMSCLPIFWIETLRFIHEEKLGSKICFMPNLFQVQIKTNECFTIALFFRNEWQIFLIKNNSISIKIFFQ